MSSTDVPQAVLERYKRVALTTVEHVLHPRGYTNIFMEGVRPLTPGKRLAARARTLRYVPHRPDFRKVVSRGEESPPYQAMALCGPGDALVVDGLGFHDIAVLGDTMTLQPKMG